METVFWLFLIAAPFSSFLLWFFFGRDRPIIETVEFRPPEGLTPAEVGLLWDGKVHDRDISAMFLDWANKGIISIEEFARGDLLIHRKGVLPSKAKPFEEKLYRGLFIISSSISARVLATEIYNIKNDAKDDLLKMYGSNSIKSLYDLRSLEMRNLVFVIALLPFIFHVIYLYTVMGVEVFEGAFAILNMGRMGTPLVVLAYLMVKITKNFVLLSLSGKPMTLSITGAFFLSPFFAAAIILFAILGAPLFKSPLHAAFAMLSTVLCVFIAVLMPKRTFFYSRVLGKIRGYANFIRAAELDRLKMLLKENPGYTYDMLPYVWAMGMLEEWSELLERYSLVTGPPSWYKANDENVAFSYSRMTDSLKKAFGDYEDGAT